MSRIVLADDGTPFNGRSPELGPLGGAETAFVSLAAAMARLATDETLRASLAQAGRAAYLERFSKQAIVGQYLAFFDRIMAGNSSRTVTGSVTRG